MATICADCSLRRAAICCAVSAWVATSRAALTGLRKRGFAVALDRSDKERGSIYRIEKDPNDRVAAALPTDAAEPNSETASKKTHREANSKAHRAA